jgi:hypothetical protein
LREGKNSVGSCSIDKISGLTNIYAVVVGKVVAPCSNAILSNKGQWAHDKKKE